MLFVLYIICTLLPVVGHIMVGVTMDWGTAGQVLLLQILTCIPLVGPIAAFFLHGVFWMLWMAFLQSAWMATRHIN